MMQKFCSFSYLIIFKKNYRLNDRAPLKDQTGQKFCTYFVLHFKNFERLKCTMEAPYILAPLTAQYLKTLEFILPGRGQGKNLVKKFLKSFTIIHN